MESWARFQQLGWRGAFELSDDPKMTIMPTPRQKVSRRMVLLFPSVLLLLLRSSVVLVVVTAMSSEPVSKKVKIMSTPENPRIIALFDVDGTLTIPRGEVTEDMMTFMKDLSKKITVGIVGGSDLPKQEEQLGDGIVHVFPYNFSQNGLVAYKNGEMLESQTISKFLGEANIKRVVNWVLKYLSELDIPVKVSIHRTSFA